MLLSDKYDLEKDNSFYVSDLDEALEVANYLEEEYGYDSDRAKGRIFYNHQASPLIVYDTDDGFTVIRDHVRHSVMSFGIRLNFIAFSDETFLQTNDDGYTNEHKYLTKDEVLSMIERADIEWEEILEGDDF